MGIAIKLSPERGRTAGLLLLALAAFPACNLWHQRPAEDLQFALVNWQQALPKTARGHCPDGLNATELEHFRVSRKTLQEEIRSVGYEAATLKLLPPDACQEPLSQEDPGFNLLDAFLAAPGLDLDGQNSQQDLPTACEHTDFVGINLKPGVDNQYARLVGCSKAYIQGGFLNLQRKAFGNDYSFNNKSRVVLIEITGVNNRKNDDHVQVRMSSGTSGLRISSAGLPLSHASFSQDPNPRFHGKFTDAKIVDGILRSEPMDLRLRLRERIGDQELYWRDAQLEAVIDESGNLSGTIGYFWDSDNLFQTMHSHNIEGIHTGRLAALARGYMCAGFFHAMQKVADGHPDATGTCTSISAAHEFDAVPAFVIEPPTKPGSGLG